MESIVLRRFCLASITSFFCVLISPSISYSGVIKGIPDVVVCDKADGGKVVLRILQTRADGSAVYRGIGNNIAIIDKHGVMKRAGAPDCDGKTLKELRKSNKAFDLVR
jgi:hypothetical protein